MDLDALHAHFTKFKPMLDEMHEQWTKYKARQAEEKEPPLPPELLAEIHRPLTAAAVERIIPPGAPSAAIEEDPGEQKKPAPDAKPGEPAGNQEPAKAPEKQPEKA